MPSVEHRTIYGRYISLTGGKPWNFGEWPQLKAPARSCPMLSFSYELAANKVRISEYIC